MKVAIYGIGNFGYALLKHLDNKKDSSMVITAYDRKEKLRDSLSTHRSHTLLHKTIKISERIIIASSVKELVDDADILVLAANSEATREVVATIKPYLSKNAIIVNTAKALDFKTGKRLSEIIFQELGDEKKEYALFAGGTIAKDLFNHYPLGAEIACKNMKQHERLAACFSTPNLHIHTTSDLIGVEYASAFKNVISILAGIISGLGLPYGTETHVISQVAQEIEEIVTKKLGGSKTTFRMGSQCWGNDMWMSCTGPTRNREFGVLLGNGHAVDEAKAIMTMNNKTVEGINTISVLDKVIPNLQDHFYMNFLYECVYLQRQTSKQIKDLWK